MDKEENLDLLDLEDNNEVDALPEATPFSSPRPKKPWLLMGLGVAIIVLATWIIVAKIGGNSDTSVSVDLDTPIEAVDNSVQPVADLNVPEKPAEPVAPVAPVAIEPAVPVAPVAVEQAKPVETNGNPVRVVEDRKDVTFNPDKVTESAPVPKPVAKAQPKKTSAPAKKQTATASSGSIYVQFGSYSSRAAAQSAEQKMRSAHGNLFNGKQFVILAAQVKGATTYRLRVPFHTANEANGFCRNAKSDGLDCYVTK
ncbi:MAG: SPOR domain-containing protein [Alphaproteobacteria bacterium]|nr:SPOR domain-containing protein [Alphaproteobacteria bacterium]